MRRDEELVRSVGFPCLARPSRQPAWPSSSGASRARGRRLLCAQPPSCARAASSRCTTSVTSSAAASGRAPVGLRGGERSWSPRAESGSRSRACSRSLGASVDRGAVNALCDRAGHRKTRSERNARRPRCLKGENRPIPRWGVGSHRRGGVEAKFLAPPLVTPDRVQLERRPSASATNDRAAAARLRRRSLRLRMTLVTGCLALVTQHC